MTHADQMPTRTDDHSTSSVQRGSTGNTRHSITGTIDTHIAELERENNRLQLLVAELLIKNQRLRKSD